MSETRKKILSNKENHPLFGKKFSDESKKKMSRSHMGIKQSDETIEKRRQKWMGENNPMYGISLLGKWIEKYGLEEANKKYMVYRKTLSNSKRKSKNIWHH